MFMCSLNVEMDLKVMCSLNAQVHPDGKCDLVYDNKHKHDALPDVGVPADSLRLHEVVSASKLVLDSPAGVQQRSRSIPRSSNLHGEILWYNISIPEHAVFDRYCAYRSNSHF